MATVEMPSSRQARITRTAISPRFAMSTLENTPYLPLMDFERAKAALAGLRFADLRWVAATGSTNDDVRRWLTEGSAGPEPVVLVADHQTQGRSEEHTSELQSREKLVCRLLLEKKKSANIIISVTSI